MEGGSSSNEHEVRPETSRKRAREDDQDFLEEQPSKKLVDPQHSQFVAMHYNAREETGVDERKNSRIFYMRNFNNWIKSQLINEYLEKIRGSITHGSPLRVLDMCCGKGGDLLKWLKG